MADKKVVSGIHTFNDIIETMNSLDVFDFIVEPLSLQLIREYHQLFKSGTSDDKNGFSGNFKKIPSMLSCLDEIKMAEPYEVESLLSGFIEFYNNRKASSKNLSFINCSISYHISTIIFTDKLRHFFNIFFYSNINKQQEVADTEIKSATAVTKQSNNSSNEGEGIKSNISLDASETAATENNNAINVESKVEINSDIDLFEQAKQLLGADEELIKRTFTIVFNKYTAK